MTIILVSPTEPPLLREEGIVSMAPEDFGADIMWTVPSEDGPKNFGVQRKQFPQDFISSIHDGRLGEQVKKMAQLDQGFLLLEGNQQWTIDGKLMDTRWPWTRSMHRRMLASIQSQGVQIQTSVDIHDTLVAIDDLVEWSKKTDHRSLDNRPGPDKDQWGRRTNKSWQKHFIQGLPTVGPVQAENILGMYGFPFELRLTKEQLLVVPGIGKTRADKILAVFEK